MNKILISIAVLIAVAAIGYVVFQLLPAQQKQGQENNDQGSQEKVFNPKNAEYTIDGKKYTLVNGEAEETIPGSASKTIVRYWSEPIFGDLNRDDIEDGTFILTQDFGGSGTFFYVVAAIQNADTKSAQGTNAVLLGDRIAPQNISIEEGGIILVNYADRLPDEPFAVQPSQGVSKWLVVLGGSLKELHICSAQEKMAEVCTLQYDPVCGDDLETYGNGCAACASNKANSWISGACEENY